MPRAGAGLGGTGAARPGVGGGKVITAAGAGMDGAAGAIAAAGPGVDGVADKAAGCVLLSTSGCGPWSGKVASGAFACSAAGAPPIAT